MKKIRDLVHKLLVLLAVCAVFFQMISAPVVYAGDVMREEQTEVSELIEQETDAQQEEYIPAEEEEETEEISAESTAQESEADAEESSQNAENEAESSAGDVEGAEVEVSDETETYVNYVQVSNVTLFAAADSITVWGRSDMGDGDLILRASVNGETVVCYCVHPWNSRTPDGNQSYIAREETRNALGYVMNKGVHEIGQTCWGLGEKESQWLTQLAVFIVVKNGQESADSVLYNQHTNSYGGAVSSFYQIYVNVFGQAAADAHIGYAKSLASAALSAEDNYLPYVSGWKTDAGSKEHPYQEVITYNDVVWMDPVGIILKKEAVSGTGEIPSLEGAEFSLSFYEDTVAASLADLEGLSADRKWIYKTDEEGFISLSARSLFVSGDELYYNRNGRISLPQGTLVIKETKTPDSGSYFINNNTYIAAISIDNSGSITRHRYVQEEGSDIWTALETQNIAADQEADLDLAVSELLKPSISTEALDNITGTHTGVNKANDTITDTVYVKNAFPGREYTFKAELRDLETGEVLASVTKDQAAPSASDTYIDYEVTMPAFRIRAAGLEGRSVVVYEYMYYKDSEEVLAEHTGLVDEQIIRYPEVSTTAADKDTGSHAGAVREDAAVTDEVRCTNLVIGQEYTVSGTLRYQNAFTDVNGTRHLKGEEVAVKDSSETVRTFTAEAADVTVELTFIVDSSVLSGVTVVAFEDLLTEDVKVAAHADLEDEEQSVHYPEIATAAADIVTEDEVGLSGADVSIIDAVSMHNLVPGTVYKVTGSLHDRETGLEITQSGISITGETFTAEAAEEIHYVTFTGIDSELFAGKSIVVYEKLFAVSEDRDAEVEIALHEDISDTDQTVHYPDIHTNAVDCVTGDHQGTVFGRVFNWIRTLFGEVIPAEGQQMITDTVSLSNLVPGKTYTVEGVLMNKSTGEPLEIDGEQITQKAIVTVTDDGTITAANGEHTETTESDIEKMSVSGSVDLVFLFDSAELVKYGTDEEEAADAVVYETLKYKGIEIAAHRELEDESQTVHEPSISTCALDKSTGSHTGDAPRKESTSDSIEDSSSSVIIDTVHLEGLIAGEEYKVRGYLVSREDSAEDKPMYLTPEGTLSEDISQAISAETVFTAEDAAMDAELEFDISTEHAAGRTIVVFETLYHNGAMITAHADTADEDQTIWYPDVETTAFVNETSGKTLLQKTVPAQAETVHITDIAVYTNTIPSEAYSITGHLAYTEDVYGNDGRIIHHAGELLKDADGRVYEASVELVSDEHEADGRAELVFEVDPSDLKGQTIVAFEELIYNNVTVAAHADITDEDQKIYFPEIGTRASSPYGANVIDSARTAKIIDTVSFRGLDKNAEYIIRSSIYDKTSGKMLDGVDAWKEFSPDAASGETELEITADTSAIAGHTLVVFEELYIKSEDESGKPVEILVAVHNDPADSAQMVAVKSGVSTGDPSGLSSWLIIALAAFAASGLGAGILIYLRKRSGN